MCIVLSILENLLLFQNIVIIFQFWVTEIRQIVSGGLHMLYGIDSRRIKSICKTCGATEIVEFIVVRSCRCSVIIYDGNGETGKK